MKFEGTAEYVATPDLTVAVNAAIALERPLLVKGEPGTGKTELARQIAASLGLPLLEWHVKSTTKAAQGLYEYDAVSRLRDSQLGEERVHDVRNYIRKGPLWRAFDGGGEGRAPDRRDRQGGHRVPERPAAGARPDGVLRLRDRRDGPRQDAADRRHHLEQREGAAGRLPAPLLLPLYPLPRRGDADADRRGAFPAHQAAADPGGADAVLRDPRDAGAEEEALDLGGARLAEAAARRGPRAGGPAAGCRRGRCRGCTGRS